MTIILHVKYLFDKGLSNKGCIIYKGCLTIMKTVWDKTPPQLFDTFDKDNKHTLRNLDTPWVGLFFDVSKNLVGKQSIDLRSCKKDRNIKNLNIDEIRIELKKAFFPYVSGNVWDKETPTSKTLKR